MYFRLVTREHVYAPPTADGFAVETTTGQFWMAKNLAVYYRPFLPIKNGAPGEEWRLIILPDGIPAKDGYAAVLSTTVLPLDGAYRVKTLPPGMIPSLVGVPHYIGHPDTREIVESLGAVQAPTKLFPGLQPGEQAICFPIAQGKSTRAVEGFTSPHQEVSLDDLQVRIITRLE